MDTQLGYWRWKLFRWNNHPNPYLNRPGDALSWLRQFQDNSSAMIELSNLLRDTITAGYPPTDPQEILQQLADKMSTGEIMACVELCGQVSIESEHDPGESEIDLSSLPAESAPAPPAETEPEETPEQTLEDNTDPEAMAEALKDAAEDGAPFCEECAKAAAELAAKKFVDDQYDVEPEMAQVLKTASQKGAPFCEECAKAAAKLAREAKSSPPPSPQDEYDVAPETAKVLKDAAKTGVPFCEECEKARKKQEQETS